jgi:hypothetical protein
LAAFDQSLAIHADNPKLKDLDEKIRQSLPSASSLTERSRPVSDLGMSLQPLVNPASKVQAIFAGVYGTLGNSVLSDLTTGFHTLNNDTTSSMSNNRTTFPFAGVGVEAGYRLDQNDCFGVGLEWASVYGFSIDNGDPENHFTERLTNQLFTIEVNYAYLTPDHDGPWIARFGVDYYQLGFSFYENEEDISPPVSNQVSLPSGSGSALGASVALGKDFDLGGFDLELLGKVKVGTITQLTGIYTNTGGHYFPNLSSNGTGALATAPDGSINLVDQTQMSASGERYTLMELLGYELRLGLNYCF